MNDIEIDSNLVIEALQGQVNDLSRRLALAEAYALQLQRTLTEYQQASTDES